MIGWFEAKRITCSPIMRKFVLFDLMVADKPQEKTYINDSIICEASHDILRLPPYMREFNVIE